METIINSKINGKTVNHLQFMQELSETNGVKLIAVKRGSDEAGFAIVSKANSVVKRNGVECNRINPDAVVYFHVAKFREIKAQYATTQDFFSAMLEMLIFNAK